MPAENDDLRHFLDAEGKLIAWPAKPKKQMQLLRFLAEKLEWDRFYTEPEINALLNAHHLFDDAALLRRELYMKHFLDRKSDGSSYWKTPRMLPAKWHSERLMIRDAVEKDLEEIQKIYDECAYIGELTGYHDEQKDPILKEFRHELLPPNGKPELHRLQTILEKETGAMVGYFIPYHGYPDHQTFWIALLAIRPTFQRKKFGKEIIDELMRHVRELGTYTGIGLAVGVGNDPGLKFWNSCGFTNVIKTEDHGTHKDMWIVQPL